MVDRDDDTQRTGDRGGPKRKGPIVNRRGPSEISRAIQMMSNLNGKTPSGKKTGPAGAGRGTVIRIDRAKGYGFILDSSGEQRFFHRTSVMDSGFDSLEEQQSVDFEPYTDERGARAQKVRPAGARGRDGATSRPQKPSAKGSSPKAPSPKTPAWKSDLSPFRSGSGSPSSRKKPKI